MTLTASVISYGRTLADLLYPPACLLCGVQATSRATPPKAEESRDRARVPSSSPPICQACDGAMPRVLPPTCTRCGVGLPGAYDAQWTCLSCQRHPPVFDQACAPFAYAQAAGEAIRAFKYQGRHRLGSWFAAQMARSAQRALPLANVSAIVPVPLHWVKRRLRRLDPPFFLAQALAMALARPYVPLLRRIRWTTTQTALSPSARVRNVHGAFVVAPQESNLLNGVLLVDDVMTSGATANACAQTLREAGIQPVYVVTAARTPRP